MMSKSHFFIIYSQQSIFFSKWDIFLVSVDPRVRPPAGTAPDLRCCRVSFPLIKPRRAQHFTSCQLNIFFQVWVIAQSSTPPQSTHINRVLQCTAFPLVGIGTPPLALPQASLSRALRKHTKIKSGNGRNRLIWIRDDTQQEAKTL